MTPKYNPPDPYKPLTFGIITDIHYADKQSHDGRHYRDSLMKLREALIYFENTKVDFIIVLGDIIDHVDAEADTQALELIRDTFERCRVPVRYVLGNHDLGSLSKETVCGILGLDTPHYQFETEGYRFIVLDTNYTPDGEPYNAGNFDWTRSYVPSDQLDWLNETLTAGTTLPTFIFSHHRLMDGRSNYDASNSSEVRSTLDSSGAVVAAFHGHYHEGGVEKLNEIPYITLRAMVTGKGIGANSWALCTMNETEGLHVIGSRMQDDMHFPM